MKEIKFRAYNRKDKRFYYFDLETVTKTYYPGYYHPITGEKDCELDDPILYSEKQLYTGHKDMNNVEIYDGDIVKAEIYTDDEVILEVKWENCAFVIDYEDSEVDMYVIGYFPGSLEVIGNIHQNEELLEKK